MCSLGNFVKLSCTFFLVKYDISLGNFLKHLGINLSDVKKLQEHFYWKFPQTHLRHACYLLNALAASYSHLMLLRFLKLQATMFIQLCSWAQILVPDATRINQFPRAQMLVRGGGDDAETKVCHFEVPTLVEEQVLHRVHQREQLTAGSKVQHEVNLLARH
jgi:hypothetical protein